MAYYSGSVNTWADLRTALFNACTANGWTLNVDILTKGAVILQVTVNSLNGLIFQGATGVSSGVITGASLVRPRLGPFVNATPFVPTFPITYEIHIFDNEVYLVVKFNVDRYYWVTFGKSIVPGVGGTGGFISACATFDNAPADAIHISAISGGSSAANRVSSGPFWFTGQSSVVGRMPDTINTSLDSTGWTGAIVGSGYNAANAINASLNANPLIARMPSLWNSESILLRMQVMMIRPSNKQSLVLDLEHARYVRIDNYNPGQIIQLGSDKWIVYPFHQKNITARDGGTGITHTGTFAWAIRYTGP